eukprot:TRINITY_DN4151_c0_g1_i4.p1 TRINITY_DN4151_c0_g1~~TRINITY_DN4151_c0_g1_i4.p1  ORF type:complete len:170 (+),score=33.36 TRINITY_DN4151_c0_g1_i4:65-574(+)
MCIRDRYQRRVHGGCFLNPFFEKRKKMSKEIVVEKKGSNLVYESAMNPFLQETDPKNPYGPNFIELPYLTKVYYKYTRLKKYVHLTPEDQREIGTENLKFYFGMVATFGLGILSANLLKRFVFPKLWSESSYYLEAYSIYYRGFFGSAASTLFYSNDRKVQTGCNQEWI